MTKKQIESLGKRLTAEIKRLESEQYDARNNDCSQQYRHAMEAMDVARRHLRIAFVKQGFANREA